MFRFCRTAALCLLSASACNSRQGSDVKGEIKYDNDISHTKAAELFERMRTKAKRFALSIDAPTLKDHVREMGRDTRSIPLTRCVSRVAGKRSSGHPWYVTFHRTITVNGGRLLRVSNMTWDSNEQMVTAGSEPLSYVLPGDYDAPGDRHIDGSPAVRPVHMRGAKTGYAIDGDINYGAPNKPTGIYLRVYLNRDASEGLLAFYRKDNDKLAVICE